jgi:hypothetical protein
MDRPQESTRSTPQRVLDRVAAVRRAVSPHVSDPHPDPSPEPDAEAPSADEQVQRLRVRLEHLEQEVEGLQDAVHRESCRRDAEIAALQRKLQPELIARSLSADARKRGL